MIELRGLGHASVRASHGKTLEFTPDVDLGAGGTCVVAVGSRVSGEPMAGAVHCCLRVGDLLVRFDAQANPKWDPSGAAVLRRSAVRKPDTIATHASLSAANLPLDLVTALRDPSAEATLTLEHVRPQPPRLVLANAPDDAERAAADAIAPASPGAIGGRVLLLGNPSAELLAGAPQPIEVLDRVPAEAVAAASPHALAHPISDDPADRDHVVVLRVTVAELDKTLRTALRRGRRTGAILAHPPWVHWGELDALPRPDGVRHVWVCLDPVPAFDLDRRISELRADGIPVKQIAKLLSAESGLPANQIYRRATS